MAEAPNATGRLDKLCIDTIRTLAMDAVQKANSGHPGTPMGLAPLGLRPLDEVPASTTRATPTGRTATASSSPPATRSMLLYSLLHLTGYDLTLDDIKQFRQWESKTPGHPERGRTPGVEVTTGPLGPGHLQRRRHGHRRAHAGRALQPPRPRDRRPLHLRHRQRRRHDGGRLVRGLLAGRPPRPGQADRLLRRQPHHHRRLAPTSPSARTSATASAPTAGTSCRSTTATTSRRSTAPSQQARAEREPPDARRRANAHRLRLAEQAGHGGGPRRAPRRGRGAADEAEPGLAVRRAVHRAGGSARRLSARPSSAGGPPKQAWRRPARRVRAPLTRTRRRSSSACSSGACPTAGRTALPSFDEGEKMATRAASGAVLNALAAAHAGARRRLRRPGALHRHLSQGLRRRHERRVLRAQLPLRRPRARHGARSSTAWPRTAASASTAAPSSSSPTTCARRSGWRRWSSCPSSSSTATTPSAWARTARRISPSSTWPACAPSRTCCCCAPPTPTRRWLPGASRWSATTAQRRSS